MCISGRDIRARNGNLVTGGLAKGGRYRAREVRDEETRTAMLDYLAAAKHLFALETNAPVWTPDDQAEVPGERLTSHASVHNLKRYAAEAEIDHLHLHQTRYTSTPSWLRRPARLSKHKMRSNNRI
jgi:hypothetical protein